MKKWFGICLVMGAFLMSGCSTYVGRVAGTLPKINSGDDYVTIHILRKSGHMGCEYGESIRINGQVIYILGCGERIVFRVPVGQDLGMSISGKLIIASKNQTDKVARNYNVNIKHPQKDQHYFFGCDCHPGACWFGKVTQEEYEKADFLELDEPSDISEERNLSGEKEIK